MNDARYIVGIDLGTTNIAVFYLDTYRRSPVAQQFSIPQLVRLGERDDLALLPSFCYLPSGDELPSGALELPWRQDLDYATGAFARDHGARVPGRLISSAKSWLTHAGVDRTKPILPWGCDVPQPQSPVAVTARYLDHVRCAWNHRFVDTVDRDGSPCRLEDQDVVITVPASFDETARELTITAAREAGLSQIVLLEEPLAAFYAWLGQHEAEWEQRLTADERVLVCDVGGGTTDFSFIEMDANHNLHRFAVGEHLLLGGDNIDIALARTVEAQWERPVDRADWAMLVQQCRAAKEALLEAGGGSRDITLFARGSSLMGSARTATLNYDTVVELLCDGFFPLLAADADAPRRQTGMRTMGLPYASEPAITCHLLSFLRYAARMADSAGETTAAMYPAKVLFNGGSLIPALVRERLLEAIAQWFPNEPAPTELTGTDYSLAVAAGAAYYGRVRRGDGVAVRGGTARAYYLETVVADKPHFVCVVARDTEEARPVTLDDGYRLQANQKVRFSLYSSATRLHDQPGDMVDVPDELTLVAPLTSLLQHGQMVEKKVDVKIVSELTEIGSLDIVLESADSDHRWPLRFDLRARDAVASSGVILDSHRAAGLRENIRLAFTDAPDRLSSLPSQLEAFLKMPRAEWSMSVLREIADELLTLTEVRSRSPRHERRWFNLAGLTLRPGFGDAADTLRMRQVWKLWFAGIEHDRDPQVIAEWWVFWRRVCPGLKSGHHATIAAVLEKVIIPKGAYRLRIREGEQARMEMWRCLGSLEQLSVKAKRRISRGLVARGAKLTAFEFWVLGRLLARRLFHASADAVVPGAQADEFVRELVAVDASSAAESMHLFALSRIASHTADRVLDIEPDLRDQIESRLVDEDCPDAWLRYFSGTETESASDIARVLGDRLPVGLLIQ